MYSEILYSENFGLMYCRILRVLAVFRYSVHPILLGTQYFGVRYCGHSLYFKWFRILYCGYCTARTGRISSVGAAILGILGIFAVYSGVWSIILPFVHPFDNSIPTCMEKIFTDGQLEYFECWQYFGSVYGEYS